MPSKCSSATQQTGSFISFDFDYTPPTWANHSAAQRHVTCQCSGQFMWCWAALWLAGSSTTGDATNRTADQSRCLDAVLYCTVLYCTVLYCTLLYCTVLYCTVLYCTVLYCTVLYCTVLYCTVLYYTVLYNHSVNYNQMSRAQQLMQWLNYPMIFAYKNIQSRTWQLSTTIN